MTAPMIKLRDLRKVWNPDSPKALTAIDGLSLDVAAGEFVVLLGPSGHLLSRPVRPPRSV